MWNTFSVRLSRSAESATEAMSLTLHNVSHALKPIIKNLNLLGEIFFDLITFCQDERIDLRSIVLTFVVLSDFLYLSYGVVGSLHDTGAPFTLLGVD